MLKLCGAADDDDLKSTTLGIWRNVTSYRPELFRPQRQAVECCPGGARRERLRAVPIRSKKYPLDTQSSYP